MTVAVLWEIKQMLQRQVSNVCIDIAVFIYNVILSCLETLCEYNISHGIRKTICYDQTQTQIYLYL